jgi:hypothetical protein
MARAAARELLFHDAPGPEHSWALAALVIALPPIP